MGKLILTLGTCLVVAGGAALGLFRYADQLDDSVEPVACFSVTDGGELTGCCCPTVVGGESSAGIAAAGPAALFTKSPVTSDSSRSCLAKANASGGSCLEKADPYAGCCDLTAGAHGLEAVAGVVVSVAKK